MTPVDRIEALSTPVTESGCWLWIGHTNADGYGKMWFEGRPQNAHRAAYATLVGPIPVGMEVCHRCDTPACVNPAHLWLGTHRDNMHDRDRKGRTGPRKGAHNGNARLSESDVICIRERLQAERIASIAQDYGVSHSCVFNIKHRRTWRHI